MQRETLEKAIKDAIVKRAATSRPAREKIYSAARASLRRRPDLAQEDLAQLDAAIEAIEATFMRRERPPPGSERVRPLRIAAIALLAGVALGAGVPLYLNAQGAPSGKEGKAFAELRQTYRNNVSLMPEATKFIRQVVDAVVERQKSDKASLQASATKFIPLAKFNPELAKQLPKSLPPGTSMMLRADATDLKVLMNWTLCGVASISHPEMVDKKRAPQPSVGCPFFGLWTNGAADW